MGYENDDPQDLGERNISSGCSGSGQEQNSGNNPNFHLVGEGENMRNAGSATSAMAGSAESATSRPRGNVLAGSHAQVSAAGETTTDKMAAPQWNLLIQQQNEMMLKLVEMVSDKSNPAEETVKNKTVKRRRVSIHDLSDDEEEVETGPAPKTKKKKIDRENSASDFLDGLDEVSDEEGSEEADSFMDDLQQFFETGDSTAPDLEEKLANVVNNSLRVSVGEQKINDLCEKLLRPKNCEALVVPKVNQEIWTRLQR